MQEIVSRRAVESLLRVEVTEHEEETFRKVGRGRPSKHSNYRREVRSRFSLAWCLDNETFENARVDDGVFPLLTNDRKLTPREVLHAYKRQPRIEKRFTQLKSDLNLTPVFLKSPERVVGLFTIYFLALLVQSLIERDLRNALAESAAKASARDRRWEGPVEVCPEGRRTRRPTARHVLDLFEGVRRHEILQPGPRHDDEPLALYDDLAPAPSRVLQLLGIDAKTYGR